jgi:hypothetical protein
MARKDVTAKEAIKALRSQGKSQLDIALEVLRDEETRVNGAMLCAMATPVYETSYVELLDEHGKPRDTARWWAELAAGSWQDECRKILATCTSLDILTNIGFSLRPDVDPTLALYANGRAKMYLRMCATFVAYRVRSQAMTSYCFPDRLACVGLDELDRAQNLLNASRDAWGGIVQAEQVVAAKGPRHREIGKVLADMHFVRMPLVRECCLILLHAGWDADDPTTRDIIFSLYSGRGNTKQVLEDTFQHLRLAENSGTRHKIGMDRIFYEVCRTPKLQPKDDPEPDDYITLAVSSDNDKPSPPDSISSLVQPRLVRMRDCQDARLPGCEVARIRGCQDARL